MNRAHNAESAHSDCRASWDGELATYFDSDGVLRCRTCQEVVEGRMNDGLSAVNEQGRTFEVGQKVVLWVGLELMMPGAYGNRKGTVKQFMPDYPGGPAYEVVFDDDAGARTPYVCVKPQWVFPRAAS